MEKAKTNSKLTPKLQKLKAQFLSAYYGNPQKDLKIIAVTGTTGKSTVAHYIHEIIKSSGEKSALIISDSQKPLTLSSFQKSLSKAWREGANFVVLEAPASAILNHAFLDINFHTAVFTDFIPNQPGFSSPEDYLLAKSSIFSTPTQFTVLNRDDSKYDHFAKLKPLNTSASYGRNRDADLRINHSKVYKKGTEANFTANGVPFDVASFVTGEEVVSLMAAAAATALLLKISTDHIVDGIASYEP